ncbi:hypothetical protein [uncultured Dechloromonas sp.]|uniref:hypothetical protein n=1 Tax=uncultured Dechloromonas sp. TaxID=171719 RepID=UPI0025E9DC50|nr:hypothetical protein [uncultured Dechloromonas sp.]
MEKFYRTPIWHPFDAGDLPDCVTFCIDDESALEILRLSALVKTHGLYKVEKFDFRAHYTRTAEANPGEANGGQASQFVTEADRLNVSDTEFWFSAYLKHTDVVLNSEAQPIADLKESFGLTA